MNKAMPLLRALSRMERAVLRWLLSSGISQGLAKILSRGLSGLLLLLVMAIAIYTFLPTVTQSILTATCDAVDAPLVYVGDNADGPQGP